MFGNGNSPGDPIRMGIKPKLGNGNGKEWESAALEWEGMGIKNPF